MVWSTAGGAKRESASASESESESERDQSERRVQEGRSAGLTYVKAAMRERDLAKIHGKDAVVDEVIEVARMYEWAV